MKTALLLLLALTACGGPLEEEAPGPEDHELPAVNPSPAPGLPYVLPPGWFVHLYPGLCSIVLRDDRAVMQRCVRMPECAPGLPYSCPRQ